MNHSSELRYAAVRTEDCVKRLFRVIVLGALGVGLSLLSAAQTRLTSPAPKLVQSIELPGVKGRIDHMSIDVKGKRLFLAALGNKTVEVIDVAAGKTVRAITGLKEPQGILFVPETDLLFVADGQGNACYIYDGSSYKLIRTEPGLDDADNIAYDQRSANTYGVGLVDVGYGSGSQAGLRALDSKSGKPMFEIPVDGHPESIQLQKTSARIYISVPSAGYIAVADSSRRRVTEKWPVQGFKNIFPMALDEGDQRLFVGSRTPPALLVFDTKSGKMVANVDGVGDADDLTYDAAHKRLYMTGGAGMIAIFDQRDPDHYTLGTKLPSAPGARTSLFVPELNRLYVAAPSNTGQPARVLVYDLQP
jgi:DNA-binding beta-propeller fold protein YncE